MLSHESALAEKCLSEVSGNKEFNLRMFGSYVVLEICGTFRPIFNGFKNHVDKLSH